MTLDQQFHDQMKGQAGPLGLAVSGGSDSTALLCLAAAWAKAEGVVLHVATVNHGLRTAAEGECAAVATQCRKLGLKHDILDWRWNNEGNLQAAARKGRYDALAAWALSKDLAAVALGHTQDDVAETFLMRLERGSGAAGLARMRSLWRERDMLWRRPLLDVSRAELRRHLTGLGVQWCEDTSNSDTRFGRVKARAALDVLEGLGITRQTLSDTAERLSGARAALEYLCEDIGGKAARLDGPDVVFDLAKLNAAPDESRQQLVSQTLAWIGQTDYPPRRQAVLAAMNVTTTTTLNGCIVSAKNGQLRVSRELSAAPTAPQGAGKLWDGRFLLQGPQALQGPKAKGLTIAPLGEKGLALCEDWRATGLPRASLLASPAVWREAELIAAPYAGFGAVWQAEITDIPPFLRP